MLRERVKVVLGEVPGEGIIYRRGGSVRGESTYILKRDREKGISRKGLAEYAGVTISYISLLSRGKRNMGPAVQTRVEEAVDAPTRAELAQYPTVDQQVLWERMDAHGVNQNEVARRRGISPTMLSHSMNGQHTPSGDVLKRLDGVLSQPSPQKRVMPSEVEVLAWKKGKPSGLVIGCADGPGGDSIRVGGRTPWGAEV